MFHGHAMRGAQEQKAAGMDRDRPAERHQRDRDDRRKPYRHELMAGFVHPGQLP
jgi:hypothetical protein